MAIVLDRVTTAAGDARRRPGVRRAVLAWRRPLLGAGGAVTVAVLVYLSHTYVWAAEFPGEGEHRLARSRARRDTT